MPVCSIVADHKSEERYTKLSLAYSTEEERQMIEKAIAECTPLSSFKPIFMVALSQGEKE
jgi:hypothetical protein